MSLPVTKPKNIQWMPTRSFGIPRGTPGRAGHAVLGIVLHCLTESLEQYDGLVCQTLKINKAKPDHASVQYAVGNDGELHQYVEDANISWGFSQYLGNFPGSYPIANINWPPLSTTAPNIGVTPDYYVLNIGLEGGIFNRAGAPECNCTGPTVLEQQGYKQLVHLLAWLAHTYTIALNPQHITFHQMIDSAAEDECACADLTQLLADVAAYCEPCEVDPPYLPRGAVKDIMGRTDTNCPGDTGCYVYEDGDTFVQEHIPDINLTAECGIVATHSGPHNFTQHLTMDWCAAGPCIPAGVSGPLRLGVSAAGCVVKDIIHVDTPIIGDGSAANPFDLNLCAFGVVVPVGTATSFTGIDAGGCLVKDTVHTSSGIQGNGTTANPIRENFDNLPAVTPDATTKFVVSGGDGGLITLPQAQQLLLCNINASNETPTYLLGSSAGHCFDKFTPADVVTHGISVTDTNCVNMHATGSTISADVIISTAAHNQVSCTSSGLFVPQGAGVVVSGPITGGGTTNDPLTVNFNNLTPADLCAIGSKIQSGTLVSVVGLDTNGCLKDASIDAVVDLCGHLAGLTNNGVATPGSTQLVGKDCKTYTIPIAAAETPLTAVDSPTVDFTTSGTANHTVTASVKIATGSNGISIGPGGLYVDPNLGAGNAFVQSITDTTCVDLNVAGGALSANIKFDPSACNAVSCGPSGLLVKDHTTIVPPRAESGPVIGVTLATDVILYAINLTLTNTSCRPIQGFKSEFYGGLQLIIPANGTVKIACEFSSDGLTWAAIRNYSFENFDTTATRTIDRELGWVVLPLQSGDIAANGGTATRHIRAHHQRARWLIRVYHVIGTAGTLG